VALKLNKSIIGEFSFRPQRGDSKTYRLFRSWIVTIVLAVFLVAFSAPLILIGSHTDFSEIDDLFALVMVLFKAFWMLGWSVGVLFTAVIFLGFVFGRERVIFTPGRLMVRLELIGMGFSRFFNSDRIANIALLEKPLERSGLSWRGPHMTFDYDGELISFGTDISTADAVSLTTTLEQVVLSHEPPDDSPTVFTPPDRKQAEVAKSLDEKARPEQINSLSSIALVTANLVPIVGVLFFDWNVGEVMLLYWAESAVIGVFNVAKIWVIGRWVTLLMGPFFIGHFGGFMVGHLLFIYGFMIAGPGGDLDMSLTEVMKDFVALAPALLAFFVSHGISFYQNFLGRKEYIGREVSNQMSEPYKRIIIMHVTLIFGAFLVLLLESALPVLILMIALKVGADLRAHVGEHN
jgi:hypothetical protein